MFKILKKENLAPNIYLMDVEAPRVARNALPGQFLIVRVDDEGERVPLTICDYDAAAGTAHGLCHGAAAAGFLNHFCHI